MANDKFYPLLPGVDIDFNQLLDADTRRREGIEGDWAQTKNR